MLLKRLLDILIATTGLVVASPVLLLAAGLVSLEDRHQPFFWQPRLGRKGRLFRLYKLRSMRVHGLPTTEVGQVYETHPMVTRVGRLLRRFKIDELPQLVNVLLGDMSIVGPRPALPEALAGYDEFQRRRLEVRPGLTGWAQVNGSARLTWDERILLDVWNIDHWSHGLDLRILARTLGVVLWGERPNRRALAAARAHAARLGWTKTYASSEPL